MSPDDLFLERCRQVREAEHSHQEIDTLDLAGRLRQLVLDKHCLVAVVNKNKIKLRFEVGQFRAMPPDLEAHAVFRSLEDGLDPETSARPMQPRLKLNIDDFLSHHVMTISGNKLAVKHVIRFASHVGGSIHYDPMPDAEYEGLYNVSKNLFIGGMPAGTRILKAITRVTLKGLADLIEDVERRKGQERRT